MQAERWQKVKDLFHSAVDRAPKERAAFLNEACQGDGSLCREVKSLLASHERTKNFIESLAFKTAPELLISDGVGELIGELIGHYLIERLIGVGGMGEVYLARDDGGCVTRVPLIKERVCSCPLECERSNGHSQIQKIV